MSNEIDIKKLSDECGLLTPEVGVREGSYRELKQFAEAYHKAKCEQSDAVEWAEGLIEQLPITHDGRNSWLLNHGKNESAEWLRAHSAKLQSKRGEEHRKYLTEGLSSIELPFPQYYQTAEIERLKADARRWQYFRETASEETCYELCGNSNPENEELDKAIDERIEAENDNG